jgi:transcriptional regulator with XRE-family HTH domain
MLLGTMGAMQVNAFENFRTNMQTAMEARGLSQREIATNLKISRSHLNRVLQGDTTPSINLCDRLAGAVGFALSDLLLHPKKFSDALLQRVA